MLIWVLDAVSQICMPFQTQKSRRSVPSPRIEGTRAHEVGGAVLEHLRDPGRRGAAADDVRLHDAVDVHDLCSRCSCGGRVLGLSEVRAYCTDQLWEKTEHLPLRRGLCVPGLTHPNLRQRRRRLRGLHGLGRRQHQDLILNV